MTKLIDVAVGSDERQIRNKILDEDRKALVLRNLREQISVLKELGYTEVEVRSIVAASNPSVEKLVQLTNRGLITAVSEQPFDSQAD